MAATQMPPEMDRPQLTQLPPPGELPDIVLRLELREQRRDPASRGREGLEDPIQMPLWAPRHGDTRYYMLGRGHPGRSTHDMVADAVDARTIPLQQLEPAPLEASDGCISRCHAIVRLYQEGGSYVADLLDVRNPERTDSNRATIRPLGNAGRGPPLAPGT